MDIKHILERNEEVLKNIKHKPLFYKTDNGVAYFKYEFNDDFLYRKTKSITINAAVLEKCDQIVINISHRNVKVSASKEEIKSFKKVHTFYGETKYQYPIERWKVIDGDKDWIIKINEVYK